MNAPKELVARYRAIAKQRAAAEARHPHITLAVETVELTAWLHAAIALIDRLSQERDDAVAAAAAARHEVERLRSLDAMRERTIAGQLTTIRDLRRRLPHWERGDLTVSTVEEAFNTRHNIVEIIARATTLHPPQNGHRRFWAGICPFCGHDSLVVYSWHQQFACYVCGVGGTAADFVRALRRKENHNIDNEEAS